MAKRNTSRKDGGRYAVPVSSGYTIIVRRPSLQMITAVQHKAEQLYPMPEPPMTEMEMVTGVTEELPAINLEAVYQAVSLDGAALVEALQDLTDKEREFLGQIKEAQNERTEYLLDYIFQKRLEVEGAYTDEQKQALMDAFADDMAELEEWGELPEALAELDDWQRFLRTFIIQDQADYAAVFAAAMWAFNVADVTDEEIRQRVRFLSS